MSMSKYIVKLQHIDYEREFSLEIPFEYTLRREATAMFQSLVAFTKTFPTTSILYFQSGELKKIGCEGIITEPVRIDYEE